MSRENVQDVMLTVADARGRAVFVDDFEDALAGKWYNTGGVDGDYVAERVTTKALNGAGSVHIATPTTTPAADDYVYLQRWFGLPVDPERMEFALSFVTADDWAQMKLTFSLTLYLQNAGLDTKTQLMVRYDGGTWSSYTGGAWVAFAGLPALTSNATYSYWHTLVLSARPTDGIILSVRLDDAVVPLGVGQTGAAASEVGGYCDISLRTKDADKKELWIDDVSLIVI